MEIINRTMTISIDMKDAETILSWYKNEQERLIKWDVNPEWKKEQNSVSIWNKLQENYNLVYQISKLPRWWVLDPIKSDIVPELEIIYWTN